MATAVKRAIVLVLSKENIRPLITKEISPKKGIVMAMYIGTLSETHNGLTKTVDSKPIEAENIEHAEKKLLTRLANCCLPVFLAVQMGTVKLSVREDNSTSITA